MLGLRIPAALDERFRLDAIPAGSGRSCSSVRTSTTRTSCPWRESIADVVTIREDADGRVDLGAPRGRARRYADRPLKIGQLLGRVERDRHRHRRRRRRDAAAPPRRARVLGLRGGRPVPADRHEPAADATTGASRTRTRCSSRRTSSSAAPGTPGVLVAKRGAVPNRVPAVPGGGTILFVSPTGHTYHPDPEVREEGGTPAIVESIRAGLVFALKEAVGADEIRRREERLRRGARSRRGARTRRSRSSATRSSTGWRSCRSASATARAAALELRRRGAQRPVRDPGAQRLLLRGAVHPPAASRSTTAGRRGWTRRSRAATLGAKLSLVRVGFNYFISEAVFDYVVDAVHLRRRRRLEAAAALRVRPGHRALAAPQRGRPRAGAEPRGRVIRRLDAAADARDRARGASSPATCARPAGSWAELDCSAAAATTSDPSVSHRFERFRWFPFPGDALATAS